MRHVRMPSGKRLAGIVVSLILSIGICTAAAGISPANAAPAGNGNGAAVVRNPYGPPVPDNCELFNYNTSTLLWVFTCNTIQQVIQPGGIVTEYIKGSIDPTYPGNPPNPSSAFRDITTAQTGQPCDRVTVGNSVIATKIVAGAVTPSGQVNLTCKTLSVVTVTSPGDQSGTVGTPVSVQVTASDSAGLPLTYYSTDQNGNDTLPPGLAIDAVSGLITGTPTTPGTYGVTIFAQDNPGSTGSASFTWTINP